MQQLIVFSCVLVRISQVHECKRACDRHARRLVILVPLMNFAAQLSVPEHLDVLNPLLLVGVAQVHVVRSVFEVLLDMVHHRGLYLLARQDFATGPAGVRLEVDQVVLEENWVLVRAETMARQDFHLVRVRQNMKLAVLRELIQKDP